MCVSKLSGLKLKRVRAIVPAVLAGIACATVTSQSLANVTFSFNFTDAAGVGFNANGQTGIDRRAGLAQAAGYVSSVLGPAYTATITMDVNGSITNDTTLASAGSNFNLAYPGAGFTGRGDVQTKILGGADPSPGADGTVNWNFQDFSWAPLSTFQLGDLDLISTATHELTHAIGFSSDILQDGKNGWGASPGTASAWSPFDQFVADSAGTSIISSGGVLDGSRWNTASIGGSGPTGSGLRFNGPNAVAAAGGPVYLYSPTTWNDGSSGSHLDTDYYTGANGTIENMMNHASTHATGLDIRTYTNIELGILKDIGYTSIPEPGSMALIIVAGMGVCLRRRKSPAFQ